MPRLEGRMVPSLATVVLFGSFSWAVADTYDTRFRFRPNVQRGNKSVISAENLEHCDPPEFCSPHLDWFQGAGPFHMCTDSLVVSPDAINNVSKSHCQLLANNIRAQNGYWKASGFQNNNEYSTFWAVGTCSLAISIPDRPAAAVDIGNLDIAGFLDQAANASQESHISTVFGTTVCARGVDASRIILWRVGLSPGSTPSSATTIIPLGIFAICMIALLFSVTWPSPAG